MWNVGSGAAAPLRGFEIAVQKMFNPFKSISAH